MEEQDARDIIDGRNPRITNAVNKLGLWEAQKFFKTIKQTWPKLCHPCRQRATAKVTDIIKYNLSASELFTSDVLCPDCQELLKIVAQPYGDRK